MFWLHVVPRLGEMDDFRVPASSCGSYVNAVHCGLLGRRLGSGPRRTSTARGRVHAAPPRSGPAGLVRPAVSTGIQTRIAPAVRFPHRKYGTAVSPIAVSASASLTPAM